MAITSVGPALDPFTPTQGPAPDDAPNSAPDSAPQEAAPLPEGSGTVVDTSA
jgi:hypothetical protein